ncbi:hypothetical protein [Leptothoe spongobia]|uniref:Uncharacterized protein n=1 Tax=Leptothoe spongobia TAU-MAC 1115 TaxID=1967444 RepID=A0A947DGD4_9CYAN|nr:hypothetical protein [Leptothoe spongobia]MBT9316260.1 hypothetical protein [Leptothoe spongobia TAU-MAC 1115]
MNNPLDGMNPHAIAKAETKRPEVATGRLTMETFSMGWTLVCEHYRRDKPSKQLLKLYFRILAPKLSDDQFQIAIGTVLEKERFFPPLEKYVEYGKDEGRSLPPEQRLFIVPAEDNYDPESAAMIEARNRARGIVQSTASPETDRSQTQAQPTDITLDGLADLLERSGSDAVQQQLEMLSIQGITIKMADVVERHTQRYSNTANLEKLGNMLGQNFLASMTTKNVNKVSKSDGEVN